MPEEQFVVLHLHELLQYLNRRAWPTFLTIAQHGMIGDMKQPIDVTYLADCVIVLRYFEAHGACGAPSRSSRNEPGHMRTRSANSGSTVAESRSANR